MLTTKVTNNSINFRSDGLVQSKLVGSANIISLEGISNANVEIKNVEDPTDIYSAVNKGYVDNLIQGISWKEPCVTCSVNADGNLAITTPCDFENGSTINGVVLATGDRILLRKQTNKIENGIYIVPAVGISAERALDMNTGASVGNASVFISAGDNQSDTAFVVKNSPVVDTNEINFVKFASISPVNAGNALSKLGKKLNINVDDTTIEININNNKLKLKNGSINCTHVNFGTSTDQINAKNIPVMTHSWSHILAPTDVQDGLEKIDTKLTDIIDGNVSLTNGVATSGNMGYVDILVDDSTIETTGTVGVDSLIRVKDSGITNAKLTNSSLTVTAGDGLDNGGVVTLGGSITIDVDPTVVRTSGAQTISGVKTLNDNLIIQNDKSLTLKTSGNVTKFDVSALTGNTIIEGTLDIAGITTSTQLDATIVNVTNNATVGGDITITGDSFANVHISTSDVRMKKNINLYIPDNEIDKLTIKEYQWKNTDDKKIKIGLIAQELLEIVPNAVYLNNETGKYAVDYNHIMCMLIKDYQELKKEVKKIL